MADAAIHQRSNGRPPLLLFVHVPKTAGTTLRNVLSLNEPGTRSRALGNVFKGSGGVDKGLIGRLRKADGLDLNGAALVRGHCPLGIREYLPRHLPKAREVRSFTFLREPADRTLSHYFQIRKSLDPQQPRKVPLSPLPPDPTLDDMLEGGYVHDNLHTRMLSGLAEPFGEVDEEMLEAAKRNLREELVFFGLTERFDESLVLAKQRLGFRTILYRSTARVNTERPRGDEVPKQLRQAAERANSYDIELYRYAEELFEEAPERGELEFEVELAALRAAKAEGEIEPDGKMPAGFGGGEKAWRMLVEATARSQRLARELASSGIRAASDRARARDLKQELERLEPMPPETKELVSELEQLKAASAKKTEELEREVERLKAAAPRRARPRASGNRGRRRERPATTARAGQGQPGGRAKRKASGSSNSPKRTPKRGRNAARAASAGSGSRQPARKGRKRSARGPRNG